MIPDQAIVELTTWILPVLLAITLHEAAHGYAARFFGDPTAERLGRISLNPIRHIDPMGTVIMPALLFLTQAPFLFGWAKPVPVDPRNLRNPRRAMIWVAAAGPGMNILLAYLSLLLLHLVEFLPLDGQEWAIETLNNSVILNLVLAVFNLLPIPPLDGGKIAVGLLPRPMAEPLAQLENLGIFLILAIFLLPPLLGLPSLFVTTVLPLVETLGGFLAGLAGFDVGD